MGLKTLLKDYKLEIIIENEHEHVIYPTDFEDILIRTELYHLRECKLEMTNLLRFVKPNFIPKGCKEFDILDCHFLPSHIEKELFDGIREKNIPENLKEFCPQFLLPDEEEEEDDEFYTEEIEPLRRERVKYGDREKRSTSFFEIENADKDRIIETIQALKENIKSMSKSEVIIGSVMNKGLMQRAEKYKTEDPNSVHYSFWKIGKNYGIDFASLKKDFRVFPYQNEYVS
ncbi:hypothetical protein A6283_26575 [Bacillus wiedmannii]|uniref:hypothetical protein n=1 Tax=Bacillus wiedmannii TaxID=1890302 RepID=UPI0007DAFACC|nr:hypothetical protein [Bacillus wiedmannii]OAK23556.1 hypothetical protein A6283_26575 [Bacillus wiedmannii]PHB67912.1 hypothetical protein COE89_26700 [Bacillus wiedmannii]